MKKKILISIMLAIIIIAFTLSAKPKEETKTEYQNEQNNQFADDPIDREKNKMPKKLINAVLPEDYPKELDELFDFYYESYINIVNSIPSYDIYAYMKYENDYVKNLPISKLKKLYYLNWLANNTITEYYTEYMRINSFNYDWYDETKKNKLSFISNSTRKDIKNKKNPLTNASLIIGSPYPIITFICSCFLDKKEVRISQSPFSCYKDKELNTRFFPNAYKLVLRGKIKDFCRYECLENNLKNAYALKVEIKDAIGNLYEQKEMKLYIRESSNKNWFDKYIGIDKEILFYIHDHLIEKYRNNDPIIECNYEKYDVNNINIYRLGSGNIFPIENDIIIVPQSLFEQNYTGRRNSSYNVFKEKFENGIKEFLEKIGED